MKEVLMALIKSNVSECCIERVVNRVKLEEQTINKNATRGRILGLFHVTIFYYRISIEIRKKSILDTGSFQYNALIFPELKENDYGG